ncbi:uncharacterized protein PHALS_01882 [Plasmopara halstedii]|uniref:Uncharacterized protein n=1 Tax=Plasmopara halstedii TaxID=4781 RepID=A0A0P1A7J8_PLAHL|nr:uncharacterized protein PHALS_01882 [Plasmopara halstedii]CEG36249.1 hypothetical protein PHALS_01882 [Plasmopara halstedii]|eukprot:XP_024572618.1 hypothetical protein PHALS_01882 [Plasmopara halstedii]
MSKIVTGFVLGCHMISYRRERARSINPCKGEAERTEAIPGKLQLAEFDRTVVNQITASS